MRNELKGCAKMTNKQCKALLKAIEIIIELSQSKDDEKRALSEIQNALSEKT